MKNVVLPPIAQGLYEPSQEHDACGVGFVVDIKGRKSRKIIENALTILQNLLHRGACGSDEHTGDGVGILLQIPHKFFLRKCGELNIELPESGEYGAGLIFLPRDPKDSEKCCEIFEQIIAEEEQVLLGWRELPTNDSIIGETAKAGEPSFKQLFIGQGISVSDANVFERKLYVIRKRVEHAIANSQLAEKDNLHP
jgi:glutamate synthase (NADPH/NADH) large chain